MHIFQVSVPTSDRLNLYEIENTYRNSLFFLKRRFQNCYRANIYDTLWNIVTLLNNRPHKNIDVASVLSPQKHWMHLYVWKPVLPKTYEPEMCDSYPNKLIW